MTQDQAGLSPQQRPAGPDTAELMQVRPKPASIMRALVSIVDRFSLVELDSLAQTIERSANMAPEALATNLTGLLRTPHGVDRVPVEELWSKVEDTAPTNPQMADELARLPGRGHAPVILSTFKLQRERLSPEVQVFLSGCRVVEYNHPTTLNQEQMAALVNQAKANGVNPDLLFCFMEPAGQGFYDALPENTLAVNTAATGVDNKNFRIAAGMGLHTSNAPGSLYDDVAENAATLALMGVLNIPAAVSIAGTGSMEGCSMYQGRHDRMVGSSVGIIGLGQTGYATAKRLVPSIFSLEGTGKLLYTDPNQNPEKEALLNERIRTCLYDRLDDAYHAEEDSARKKNPTDFTLTARTHTDQKPGNENEILYNKVERSENLDSMLAESDIIIVQLPLIKKPPSEGGTLHLIDRDALLKMKARGDKTGKRVVLVNTARGPIVDETAICEALREGWIAGYATDVAENESIYQKELIEAAQEGRSKGHNTFYLFTSHTASNTANRNNMANLMVLNGMDVWEGKEPRNPKV